MTTGPIFAALPDRALIAVGGADWRSFLHGLLTQNVETLAPGEARFAGLLTPQGRLLWDLFVVGRDEGAWLEVERAEREAVIQRLTMYRLRAKVEIAVEEAGVAVFFSDGPGEGRDPSGESAWAPAFAGVGGGWVRDPRLPQLGFRGYGASAPEGAEVADAAAYEAHRLALGVPGPTDWGVERSYPIEADFDLLNGIDFKKGCFVGQETTSRMKRRGQVKSRMLPITFEGLPPAPGVEVLAGELRAGEIRSGVDGRAMALLRLDRIGGALTVEGRAVAVERPPWFAAVLGEGEPA